MQPLNREFRNTNLTNKRIGKTRNKQAHETMHIFFIHSIGKPRIDAYKMHVQSPQNGKAYIYIEYHTKGTKNVIDEKLQTQRFEAKSRLMEIDRNEIQRPLFSVTNETKRDRNRRH